MKRSTATLWGTITLGFLVMPFGTPILSIIVWIVGFSMYQKEKEKESESSQKHKSYKNYPPNFCPECGNRIRLKDKYCKECGWEVYD